MKFTGPRDGAAAVSDAKAGAGEDGIAKVREFLMPGAGEVRVDVHVQTMVTDGIHYNAFVFSQKKVVADAFNCNFVEEGRF